MKVYLKSTDKKHNSTYIPTSSGKECTCVLKEGCSIIEPVLIFDRTNVDHTYNYVYIPDFGRYYFVTNYEYRNARIIYYCMVDVLASFKTEIGSSTQYVLRSASQKNGQISDGLYPITNECQTVNYNLGSFSWAYNTYVLGIASNGGVTYYIASGSTVSDFIDGLLSDDYAETVLSKFSLVTNPQLKMMVDPLQYIVSFKWLPCDYSTIVSYFSNSLTSVSSIPVGFGTVDMSPSTMYKYTSSYQQFVYETSGQIGVLNPPAHPQASARGSYLNARPFTEANLVTPAGLVPFDLNEMLILSHNGTITADITMDMASGYTVVQMSTTYAGEKTIYVRTAFTLGVDIPITQIISKGFNWFQAGAGVVTGAIGGLLAGGAPGAVIGALGSGVSGIMDQQANRIPHVFSTGSQSGGFNYAKDVPLKVQIVYYIVADNDNDQHGSPLYEKKVINTLSGYVLCQCDDFGITGTEEEAVKIINYLNTGFYYE